MKMILPSLLFSLFVFMVAGAVWSSEEFEEMPDKHLERKDNMLQVSFL
ncbi:hypothetical protein [Brevibacillus centrosporus]